MTDDEQRDGKTLVVYADKSKAPPAASLTSAVFQRGHEASRGVEIEQLEHNTEPEATPSDGPIGARAQQVMLEQAFAEMAAVRPTAADAGRGELEFEAKPQSAPGTIETQLADAPVAPPAPAKAPVRSQPSAVQAVPAPTRHDAAENITAGIAGPECPPSLPIAAPPATTRSELQSAREAAAHWRLRRAPSGSFWERVIRDASVFIIFFAALVFVILQAM